MLSLKIRHGCRREPRRILCLCLALCLLVIGDGIILGPRHVASAAEQVNSKYLRLFFHNQEDIKRFNQKIDFSAGNGLASMFSSPSARDIENQLIVKLDTLFEKVQAILDMRKPMKKIRVNVYSDQDQLAEAFKQVFKQEGDVRGWYVYEYNTVYLNVMDVHEGMLAHELAHAIIDHFFAVRPPRATAEILATYVDKNLFEEARKY